jgi:Tat protein translocase TatB subunit
MLNLGTGELLVIFLVALIVLGPNKLPDAARQMGRMVAELRRMSNGFQDEMREAMREPTPTLPPLPIEAQSDREIAASGDAPATGRRRTGPLRADGAVPAEQQLSE